MKIDLADFRARLSFLAAILLMAGGLAYQSGKAWLATQWNESDKPARWFAAARLEPGNAQYWEHLGLYSRWNLERRNLPTAIRDLQRATELDPRNARLWMELAAADEEEGSPSAAIRDYKVAQRDFPVSPVVAWRYGSFLLRQRNLLNGFAELRRAMANDPSLETSAISECWGVDPDAFAIAERVLPRRSDYYIRAINYFVSRKQTDAALAIWRRLLTLHQRVAIHDAAGLVDDLIGENRVKEAAGVWKEVLQHSGMQDEAGAGGSLLFNGGFERDFVNGGFDWRELPVRGASYDFDGRTVHSGRRSLRITFDGSANVNFQSIYEYAPVAPRRRYRFLAYVRTARISTDSGIRFEIFDPRHPKEVQELTPSVVGTNAWTPVRADVETGPDTQLLEVLLRRAPSAKFDNKLRGVAWIDDVSLTPIVNTTMASK